MTIINMAEFRRKRKAKQAAKHVNTGELSKEEEESAERWSRIGAAFADLRKDKPDKNK